MSIIVDGGPVHPHVQAFADTVYDRFGISHIMTYDGHQPTKKQALDIFPKNRAQGDALAQFGVDICRGNNSFGIDYHIWWQQIYNIDIADYWRAMADRGSITANHKDHVHFSFYLTASAKPLDPITNLPKEDDMFSVSPRQPTYHLIAAHSGLMVEYAGSIPIDNGRPIVASPSDGGLDQRWEVVTHEDKTVTFVSRANNKAMDIPGNEAKPGQNLKAHDANWTSAQRFKIVQLDSFLAKIVHPPTGLVLDVSGGRQAFSAGRPIVLWDDNGGRNQHFVLASTI